MLEVTGLRAGYGAVNVLWDVDLKVPAGRVAAIVGPNGAGKTTLLRSIAGMIRPSAGSVRFEGAELSGRPPWEAVACGVSLIPEGRLLFRDMTVDENLRLGAYDVRARAHVEERLERAYAMFPRLRERRTQNAGWLSGGEGQMLAIARALMCEPRLLLVDEPSLGLAPKIVHELFETLATLKQSGRALIVVEQNTRLALEAADDVHLLQGGRITLSRPAKEIGLDELQARYFTG